MKIKPAIIVTVYNEVANIELLLSSILTQHLKPSEVVIIDGGSTDGTLNLIQEYLSLGNKHRPKHKSGVWQIVNQDILFTLATRSGNRSVGRNQAASLADHEWLAITDAGCILDKNWLRELVRVAEASDMPDVVAGYYQADPLNGFEEAMVPFVLVMPDRVNEKHFLPATRSMLIKKSALLGAGGFDEWLSDNEDYVLAKKLDKLNFKISFAKKALVTWIPRQTLKEFAWMIYRFARGDAFSRIFRGKVLTIYGRYLVFIWLILDRPKTGLLVFAMYLYWAYYKNRRYTPHGWYYLPVLQVVADLAVMLGTIAGLLKHLGRRK